MEQSHLQVEGHMRAALGSSNPGSSHPSIGNTGFMPQSLSQVDPSVLQQLPKELVDGIIQLLPTHREHDMPAADPILCGNMSEHQLATRNAENLESLMMDCELWIGNPPKWIAKFKSSKSLILNVLADLYMRSGSPGSLSAVLQCCMSKVSGDIDAESDGVENTINCLSEMLKQYIKQKIESDIEEIYVCSRVLKRYDYLYCDFLSKGFE